MSRGTLPCVPSSFTLTPAQQTALVTIEVAQQSMAFAAQMLAHKNIDQAQAAKVLEVALKTLDEAKMAWLASTQHAVQVVAAIPDKLKLVSG